MNVINPTNTFQRVSEIEIPEIFNRRFTTGVEDLDTLFCSEGFLPGMSFTLAAGPGTGKTTLLLQLLNQLESTGKKAAYVSGEETVHQLAFTCKRLNVQNVQVANMTCIEDIFDAVQANGFDIVILDSLPALVSRKKLRGKQLEEYLSNYITSKAKELEVVVGVILHFTKTGSYKGSTLLPHSVDANFLMTKSKENPAFREIESTKNRFSSISFARFRMTANGFVFENVELEEGEVAAPTKKKGKTTQYKESVMAIVKEKGMIDLTLASQVLECSLKAQSTLRDLTLQGILKKEGKGSKAIWTSAE